MPIVRLLASDNDHTDQVPLLITHCYTPYHTETAAAAAVAAMPRLEPAGNTNQARGLLAPASRRRPAPGFRVCCARPIGRDARPAAAARAVEGATGPAAPSTGPAGHVAGDHGDGAASCGRLLGSRRVQTDEIYCSDGRTTYERTGKR